MEKPLKTAVMGLDEPGRFLLEATRGLDLFNITAVADSDANLAQQFGKLWDCAAYDDYRQLIMQNQLDCLLVAAPLHTCVEHIRSAIKKKFHVLKLAPFARNFAEAAELVKLADGEGVKFIVANPGRFSPGALALKAFTQENPAEQFFFILMSGRKNAPEPGSQKWRSDPVLAGGGVLLYDCWEIIDQVLSGFGLPQQVYCITGNTATDSRQRAYLAEDSAIITMKFSDTLSGALLAGRSAEAVCGETQRRLTAQGHNVIIKLDDISFEVMDNQGQSVRREEFVDDWLSGMKKTLANFGSHVLDPANNPIISASAENLKIMAFIEAAYLSAKTGMPEEPARILKIA
ncbi:MAG: Gfo/Idh/MocA family oxidoreductase [Sedimentisphaerales bacterium]|nr:Gfo/Idh/MocA family oxidoreductase [Sedimentisphaerales bacterium]